MKVKTEIRPGHEDEAYVIAVYLETEPVPQAILRVMPARAFNDYMNAARTHECATFTQAKMQTARLIQELRKADAAQAKPVV